MWSRFLPLAKESILAAQIAAVRSEETSVRNVHIMLGLCSNEEMRAVRLIRASGVDVEVLKDRLIQLRHTAGQSCDPKDMALSEEAKSCIDVVFRVAHRSSSRYICTGCLLCAVIEVASGEFRELLTEMGIVPEKFYSVEPLSRGKWFRAPKG